MATIKSYTDLSQSKTLSKILPLESADMCWILVNYGDEAGSRHEPSLVTYKTGSHFRDRIFPKDHTIPCWSLAALFNVLPDTITNNDGIAFGLNVKKNIIEYSNHPSLYLTYKSVKSDNPVDACYEMIIKLNSLKEK